jgi:F-type H+-transporting ATPase subunit b
MLATLMLAAPAGEVRNPILPDMAELVWVSIGFVVLFVLMAKFAFPPVQEALERRSDRIRDSLDEAERTRAEAATVLDDYQRQLADARNEAARIIEEARQTADALKRDLATRAEAEMAEMRQRNAEAITAERDRVMSEISDQVKELAIELAEKVVEGNLDREANMRLIENYINQVEATSS